jgi:ligand-binding sensor domain-containing protein/serine phosphatase RsbU (regulator of sigma subunit)
MAGNAHILPRLASWTLLFTLLPACISLAQDKRVFHHLTVKEGLSQGSVNCIFQDRRGFMWFGTQDGLNRYDGYTCTVFKHDPADSLSINDNWILSIAEDIEGTLWVRTMKASMVNRYDPATETFHEVARDSMVLLLAAKNSVKAEWDEPDGTQWRGTIGGGLTRFDPRTGKTTAYRHDPRNPQSIADDRVYSIYQDRLGVFWIGTKEGLDRFDPAREAFIHYKHEEGNPGSLADNWVWPILEDRSGALWVGTFRGGLDRFDRTTGTFTHHVHDESDPRSLSGNQVYALYQDRSGMIWVGLNDNGVDRFHPELGAFRILAHDPSQPRSLIDNNILSIHVGPSGIPWIGTRSGLERFDKRARTFTHFQSNPSSTRSIVDNQVQSLLEDRAGTLWIGTVSNGLDRKARNAEGFTHYRHDPSDTNSLSDNRVYALAEDPDGHIWIGTYAGGLNKLDPSTGVFTRYAYDTSGSGGLSAPGIFALLMDREGTLWVGTFGGGLNRFDRKTQSFTVYRHAEEDPNSLSDDLVACLHEDRTGTLWVGTAGGLNRMDRAAGSFRRYREKDGLPNDVVFGILEAEDGRLWLSTNKGLSRFDPRSGTFQNFDYSDGLQGDEFNQNAFARDPLTGEMYFGGSQGVTVFHPDSVRDNRFVPPVVFSNFVRYNTDDKEGKPIEEKGIAAKPTVTLSYKDNVATFTFAALSFYNTSKNRYAYKLEGYSDNWIQLETDHRATFTNLDGGEYVLQVRGSNNDGVWNVDGASLRVVVTPPWWKTSYAYAGYVVAFLGVLYGLRRFELGRREQKARIREAELRAKAVEAEKRALEAENERKTKELEDARRLQLSMLPKDIPHLPGYDIGVFMRTATEVGGDYYDFSAGPDGTLLVAFGDATGHGMQAGTIVTLMKGLFLSDASRLPMQSFFQHCSRTMKEIRLGRLFMAFDLVRVQGPAVSFSSAGMPPVFLYRQATGEIEEIQLKGMPLGAMRDAFYSIHEMAMEKGDTLLFLTDGLPELRNDSGEMFDYTRVHQAFAASIPAHPDQIIQNLVAAGDSWMHGAAQDDDITLLVIQKSA